jgi:hypothetical protein
MATRKEIAQNQKILYDDAVANNMFQAAVPTFKEFQKRLEGQGYQKMVYDNYKKHNVKGKGFNNLNEFRGAFGGSFYADENKIGVSKRTQAILSSANNAVRQAKRNIQTKLWQAKKFDGGRVTLRLKNPLQNKNVQKNEFNYNDTTGKTGTYTTTDGVEFDNEYDATQHQNKLDKYGEEWNKAVDMGMVPSELDKADPDMSDTDVAMRQMERRQEWLDENQNRRSKELNESMHLQDSPFVASGGAVAPSSFNVAIGNEANRLSDAEYGAYNTAKAYNQMLRTTLLQELKEQKQRNENAGWWKDKWNDVSNYFGAMFNTMLDPKLYSQGVMDAAIASNLLQVKKGMEEGTIKKGSNAGNAAQVMLSSIQQQQGEAAKQQQYGTKAYQYGDVSGRSLKFMADFALSGWRNVMTTGFTKAGEKVGEKMALGALGKWFTKNTGRVLGDMAGSAALAATNQLGSTYNNVIERYVGMNNENGGVTQDKDGDLSFNKGVSLGKAIKDGLGSATMENFSEMFGEYLPGASKLLSKLGLSKVSSFFEKIGNNAYYKWLSNATNKSGIQGVMAEIAEEEFGTALHAAWGDGDGSWSDFNVFTNPDAREKQIDTCLGMFYSVGFMQSPRTAVGAVNAVKYFNIKHQVTKADKFGQMMFGENWDEIKNKIDVTTNADLTKTVLDATRSDSMTAKQKGAVINYAMFLSKLRGFNQASDAKTKDKVEEGETAPTLSNDLDDAYTEGHNADDADKHDIQIQHEDQAKTLAAALNISEQQLSGMSDEELESLTGQDDKLDQAIYDYQLSSARYQGVVDDAQDKVDLAAHEAEQRVNMYTDQSRGSVRNATIKASGGAEDYGVYIISGNIATHDDGSIDVSNSDDMILYFDPTTNSVEHADASMFAELGEELPADEVKAQAVADAKENAIKEVAGIIDGTVDVGSQFSVTDADGTEHTYEVLADNGDGTAMITIDGNVPTELVKGENVQIPYSFEDLQKMKDLEDQKRLEAAKTEREQMEKERARQQTQETEQTEESQPSFDFNQILNDNGNVVLVDVLGKDGNTKYPGSTLFLIRDAGAKAKVVELKSDGTLVPHAVNKEDVRATQPMSLDEYKQAFTSSMLEDNSGENRGEIEEEAPTIEGETAEPAEEAGDPESTETAATEQTPDAEQTPAITLEDGTIVPMLEDGNPDFSKLSAAQTAELYDTHFDKDADGIVSGYVSEAKKALDKANNMTVKGKTFVEQKVAKAAKEKAIADAQAAYDSAVAIRDAYNERQLAKEENTPEGRKGLIEKARRKFARLKNSEEWSNRTGDLWNETVGKLLRRLYDATGIDVFDDTPNTVYEYVAENVGPYSLNYEGNDNSKGVQQETGLSRSDFAKLGWLAAEGKGMTIDEKVHRLWENRPSNLESADTQDIRNALISLITSGQTAFQARDYILNQRIELAESALEEQLRQEEDAAEAQRVKEEEEKKKAELEKKAEEESKKAEEGKVEEEKTEDNENTEFTDNSKEESKTVEVPEDATDDAPFGEQLDESDLPFSAKDNGQQQTTSERAADVEKNKVDDMKVVDNIVGNKTRKAFERLAKMMGANIQWQYSDKLGNGWIQETTDDDGNVHRTIFITLDSSITEGAQFIFGHEMTHQIKNLNPAAYNELTQLVLDTYGSYAFDNAVDETTKRYSDAGFSGRDRDYYAEEVVADAVGEMIRDLNLAHTLAMKMSHPLLAVIHEILQKIKLAFYGTEYSDVTKNNIRSIEQAYVKTAKGRVVNSETGEDVSFSLRQKPEPKKKGVGYKVFVLKEGKLYPPMVANPDGAATPVGVWLDADAAPIAGESKTGRPQVKQGGKGTQGGSGKLAYRPGWHLGVVPYAIQFNRKDAEGNKTLFPKNFVFAEVEYAADVDYQEEAHQEGINQSGKYQHSLAGLKHLPTDGYYMYRTNPNPETDPWVITGAMKVNRILTRSEQAELVKNAGREPQKIQEGDIVTDDVVNSINQEIAAAPKFSLKVYHGSGADFTEFDFNHMGEGAGSQVFGWGGYVTSSKKIGKSYANLVDANAPHQDVEYVGNNAHEYTDVVAGLFNGGQRDYDDVKEFLQNGYNSDKDNARKKQMLEWFESTKPSDWKSVNDGKRNLYEVDIPDDNGSNYLDWENPLNEEQINAIRNALAKNGVDVSSWENRGFKLDLPFKDVYAAVLPMMMRCEPKEVSKFLSSLGFTGIKYPAGTIQGGAEEGDTNYVIFKPEDMKITQHTKFSIRLKSAIEETETNPSDAQKESGNYKKGHIKFGGYDYTIENPKGSTRSGKDADGKEWKVTMHDTYGYIRGKFGKDGDHLDMFINDKADLDNWNGDVFVVDQVNPDGSFDEHKVMYGYDSMDDAEKAYLANYSKGWQGLGNITGASKDEFDKWLDTSNRKLKPFADYAKVKFSQAQSVSEPRYSLKDIKPIGVGAFGNIYNQFRGNAKAAIEFLKKVRGGEAVGALHHKDIGDIDLVWGKEGTGHSDGYGLSKLVKYHPEVLDNLQEILNDMRVVSSSKNRVNLESETHKAGVRLTWDGERKSWLLTAFKKETSASDKRTDTAATSLEGDTALSQTEGSAAKIDNSSETTKENGEKFSLKDEKTLAGVHNITEEKLRKALKLGGLANPSLAVIDTNKTGHDNFGEISFIAPSALLDKRTGKTAGTWITDAYTQRYPSVERQMSEKGSQKFKEWVDSLEYPAADKAEIKRQTEDALSNNNAPAWELMYLKEKGIDIKEYNSKVDYRWKEIISDHPTAEDILSSMQNDSELNEKVTSLVKHTIIHPTWEKVSLEVRRKIYEETGNKVSPINPQVRKQTKEIFERDYAPTLLDKNGKPKAEDIKKVVEKMVKEHNDTKKYDFYLSKVKARDYVNKNGLYDDYIRWQEKKLDEFGTKNRIFRGYKPDGTRKYVPETLDNVSKAMREEAGGHTNGSEYTSFGSFIAKIASRVDSTDEMRDNKDKLSSNEDKEEFYEKWSEVYYDLAKFLYNDVFYGEQRLHDIVLQSDPKKYAKKEYGITLTPTFMKKLDALKNAVRTELKSAYFETKYNRPLRLNEFAAAVVPDNLGEDVRKGIENAGLPMYNYDPNKDGDRNRAFNEAINSSDNIRFSLKAEKEKIVADAKANGTYMTAPNGEKTKLDAEQWATVRTTNFKNWFGDWENDPENASKVVDENGEPMVVWHGRSAEFNTFEKEEGVRFIMGLEDKVKSEGFFFSPDKGLAEEFASNSYRHRGGKANVVPCFLNIRRPMDLTGEDYDRIYEDVTGWEYMVGMDTQDNLWGIMDEEGMADKIKEKGYDGAIFVEEVDDSYEPTNISYCALDANQIKSADNNNGNFYADNNDIRFSLRYDQFEHDLNKWKKDNNLPKDAKRPTIPQRNVGESAVDFLKRVDEYRKQMALWKTAPTYEQHLLSDDTALGEFNRELQRGSVLKRIAFQDSMLAIRKAQEAIMKEVGVDRLNMEEDAYTAENRSHGKGKNEFEEYNNEFLQPLRKAYHKMKKVLGDSYDNVRLYMMAKHGLERNAQMAFKKSLEADYEDVAQRSAAYKAYKGDINRMGNDSGFELGLIDYATWVRTDNAIKMKYSPSYMNYRYDKMGIAFDYSGLSALFDGSDFEEAAHKLVRDIESKHIVETKELWDATNAATKKILRDGYKAGMMSKDTYQYVRDMYSHYIPLRGWDGTTADQVWDYIGGGKGAFNQTLKKAHGRTSIADDPIAYIENMAESGILLNNKNWVKQHLMLLAQNHPTSLLTLSKAWYVKSTDANGNEEWIPATPQITSQMNSNQVKAAIDAFEQKMEQMEQTGDATQKRDGLNIAYPQTHSEEREHEVRVMKDGEEYVIYVNGDPQLAQAMNNTRAHRVREIQSGKLDRAAAWLGRKMAAAYTSLSPIFFPSNYFRDLTMTLASTAIREDGRYNYLLRKNLATSWNLGFMLKDYQSGKLREKVNNGNATPKEQMFYDFMMNGGETGFVSSLDVEDLKKKFKNDLKDLDRWKANPVKVGHTIMDIIEFLNRMIEDSNRFAVYMTSIQYGRSIDEAVNDAKDVTLNFNRKGTGEYGWQMIRNLYLFINPAVQSLQTLGALGKHHPFKFTAVTASWIASGVLVPIVNAALMQIAAAFGSGDGDDKKWYKDISKKYWQFTKWDRRNNFIMWFPFTHEFIKIPLAQEFRAFYGVGDMIASKMMGGELAEESWNQYAEDLLGQVVDMLPLDPTGYDGNIAVSLMPNPVRPIFELAFNVDFTGKPLFKDTEYNKYDPNFTKAYVGTPDWLVRASRMMNSIGNDYPDVQQNKWDALGNPRFSINNPAVVDHVLSSYLGGAYTMGSQVLGLLTKSLNDPKEIKVADIPLFSKFVSNPDDRPASKKQGDEFWNTKENHDRAANTLSKLKKQAKVDGDYSMLERFYGSEEYKQYKQDDVKVKKYEEDKKKERAEESGEEYRPHKLNAEDIYKAHATPKDDFEDLKLEQLYTKLNGFKSTYDLLVDTAPSQSDGYYNANKASIDAINDISFDKQKISELKKGFLDDGKDAYNAEDMKRIRELRKKVLAVLEKANKVVVANQKAKKK